MEHQKLIKENVLRREFNNNYCNNNGEKFR